MRASSADVCANGFGDGVYLRFKERQLALDDDRITDALEEIVCHLLGISEALLLHVRITKPLKTLYFFSLGVGQWNGLRHLRALA